MNQIDQLKALRDEAFARIEAARRAIEESADGKMVNSLDALIKELEENDNSADDFGTFGTGLDSSSSDLLENDVSTEPSACRRSGPSI